MYECTHGNSIKNDQKYNHLDCLRLNRGLRVTLPLTLSSASTHLMEQVKRTAKGTEISIRFFNVKNL
jgi:hypothetical protein